MNVFILNIDSGCLNEMESRAYQVTFLHLASACQNAVKELNSVTTQTNSSVAQNNDKQRHTNRPSIFFGKINFREKTLGHKLANLLLLLKTHKGVHKNPVFDILFKIYLKIFSGPFWGLWLAVIEYQRVSYSGITCTFYLPHT